MKVTLTTIMICMAFLVNAQQLKSKQTITLNTSGLEWFALHNMNGPLTVEGVEGNVASIEVEKEFSSKSSDKLKEAEESIYLDSVRFGNKIYFFMEHPDYHFEINEDGSGYYNSNNFSDPERNRVKYNFTINVKVPKNLKYQFSTHRKALLIKNIQTDLVARNHHGDLTVENAGGNTNLHTHHGHISISFSRNPKGDCNYSTHHGDINVQFQDNLNADVKMKTRHGGFYTAFEYQPLPLSLVKNEQGNGTKYVMEGKTGVRIGSGGPVFDFTTYHGDIILNKID